MVLLIIPQHVLLLDVLVGEEALGNVNGVVHPHLEDLTSVIADVL